MKSSRCATSDRAVCNECLNVACRSPGLARSIEVEQVLRYDQEDHCRLRAAQRLKTEFTGPKTVNARHDLIAESRSRGDVAESADYDTAKEWRGSSSHRAVD